MNILIRDLSTEIKKSFHEDDNEISAKRRIKFERIVYSLLGARAVIERWYGNRIFCRFSKYDPIAFEGLSLPEGRFRVMEYLVDFSFSTCSIPQAIGDPKAEPPDQEFELLFVAESELGDDGDVCRDLLKLLDVQARVRCLVFKQRSEKLRRRLENRLLSVFRQHRHFHNSREGWLFVSLGVEDSRLRCTCFTLGPNFDQIVRID